MLKIINLVNTYRHPFSRKMKKKSKIGLFVMFAVRMLGIISKYKHFWQQTCNTIIHMYGILVYDKT